MASTEGPEICRVCRCEGTLDQPLFYPCRCSGSIKYVHTDCLQSWLAHSRKPYCELCKHTFTFAPIYAPDMPTTLPVHLFIRRVLVRFLSYLQAIGRVLLVALSWLVLLPFFAQYTWHGVFWVGYRLSVKFTGLPAVQYLRRRAGYVAPPSGVVPSSGFSASISSIAKAFISPASSESDPEIASGPRSWSSPQTWDWEPFARKCLEGQIIMCITLSLFIAGFILREWVLQTLPLLDHHADLPQEGETAQPETDRVGEEGQVFREEGELYREGSGRRKRTMHMQFHPQSGLTSVRFGRRHPRACHPRPPPYNPPKILVDRAESVNPEEDTGDSQAKEGPVLLHDSKRKSPHHILPTLSRPGIWKENIFGSKSQVTLVTLYSSTCPYTYRRSRYEHAHGHFHLHPRQRDRYQSRARVRGWTLVIHWAGHLVGRLERRAPRARTALQGRGHHYPWHIGRFFRYANGRRHRLSFGEKTAGSSMTPGSSITPRWLSYAVHDAVLKARQDEMGEAKRDHNGRLVEADTIARLRTPMGRLRARIASIWRQWLEPPLGLLALFVLGKPRPVGDLYQHLFIGIDGFLDDKETRTTAMAPPIANHLARGRDQAGGEEPEAPEGPPQQGAQQNQVAAAWMDGAGHDPENGDPNQDMGEDDMNGGVEGMEQDIDDMDGLLEAVGLQGPIFLLFQNLFLMTAVLFLVLVVFVGIPYFIGRAMFNAGPIDCVLGPIRVVYALARPAISVLSHMWDAWARIFILKPLTMIYTLILPDDWFITLLNSLPLTSISSALPHPWYAYLDVALGWEWSGTRVRKPTLRAWLQDHGGWYWEDETDTDRVLTLSIFYGILALSILVTTFVYTSLPPVRAGRRRRPGGAEAFVAPNQDVVPQDDDAMGRFGQEAAEWLRMDEEVEEEDGMFGLMGEAERGALRVAGLMLKVAIFVAIELVLFPLACGLLLSILSLPLLHGATLEGRLAFATRAPLAFLFLHWTIGTAFMFGFASMVGALRSILRPGVLYFIRDPKDAGFSPLREILERPALHQLRKIGLSFQMYAVVMLLGIGAIVIPGYLTGWLGLPTPFRTLPFHWDPRPLSSASATTNEIGKANWWMGRFPLDLLILQAVVPLAILAKPLQWTFPIFKAWIRWCASITYLSSFLFGSPSARLCPRALKSPGSCRTCHSFEIRWEMELVLAPRRDGIPLPRQRPGVGEEDGVIRRRPRRVHGVREEEGSPWVETEDYQFVYAPSNLRWRVGIVILGCWIFLVSLLTLLLLAPITVGRHILMTLTKTNEIGNDLHAFLVGYATLHLCGRLLAWLVSWDREPSSAKSQPWSWNRAVKEEMMKRRENTAPRGESASEVSETAASTPRTPEPMGAKATQAFSVRRVAWNTFIILVALIIYGFVLPILLGMTGKIFFSGLISLVRPTSGSTILYEVILGSHVVKEGIRPHVPQIGAEVAQCWALGLLYAKIALQVFLLLRGRRTFFGEGEPEMAGDDPEMAGILLQFVEPEEAGRRPGGGRGGQAPRAARLARAARPVRQHPANEELGESLAKLWQLPLEVLAPMWEKTEKDMIVNEEGDLEEMNEQGHQGGGRKNDEDPDNAAARWI
ncbi:hypothetical protein BJ684DRAFT_19530 [Piptocephalis cylindrospora]|uniref:RING-type E3 ubiquitin transferase n=1 Tax=Piptocephalis cylindrospora TaxID=1907219 RepID=A0A4V1IYC0_9FUNG|nr:hypothetical protein BJ684DRAFT_19530 [Piptocephalis cylindrospora]|eukprot:RKP14029.1 hypothetical protein BJ684DRAFT_19530 [Piptocephalis cylindrospora]